MDSARDLWIDAICVDQSNLNERGEQVTLMSRIFGGAANVLVWLGESPEPGQTLNWETRTVEFEGETTVPGIDLRLINDREHPKGESMWHDSKGSHVRLLRSITLDPTWWNRTWVVQEFVLSQRTPTVFFGPCAYSWHDFMGLVMLLYNDNDHSNEPNNREVKLLNDMCTLLGCKEVLFSRKTGLSELARDLARTQASDARDKLYSILSLAKPEESAVISPSYTRSVAETYATATFAIIGATTSFKPFAYIPSFRPRPYGLPSWVVDFSFYGMDEPRPQSLFCDSGAAKIYTSGYGFDDELLDQEELGKAFNRTRWKLEEQTLRPLTEPQMRSSEDCKRLAVRGFHVGAIKDVVALDLSHGEATVEQLVTALEGVPDRKFSSWDPNSLRGVIDSEGLTTLRATPRPTKNFREQLDENRRQQ